MTAPPHRTARILSEAGARHGFFGRKGGVSEGVFASLNAGLGSGDAPANAAENRRRCADALAVAPGHLLTLRQVHSPRAVVVEAPWSGQGPEADAMVARRPDIALGVLAADCMPFLFIDPEAGVAAAAHAGWKGALAGVLESTVETMVRQGAAPDRIRAALGPCLRQREFEVGRDLVDAFCSKHPEAARFFAPGAAPEKRQFDLAGFGLWRLAVMGVTRTEDAGGSTLAEPDAYFSYRASRRAGEDDYGRNLSAIALPA